MEPFNMSSANDKAPLVRSPQASLLAGQSIRKSTRNLASRMTSTRQRTSRRHRPACSPLTTWSTSPASTRTSKYTRPSWSQGGYDFFPNVLSMVLVGSFEGPDGCTQISSDFKSLMFYNNLAHYSRGQIWGNYLYVIKKKKKYDYFMFLWLW